MPPIERLEAWLATEPNIPLFRRRINKSAICREIGIARSTANANRYFRKYIVDLETRVRKNDSTVIEKRHNQKDNNPKTSSILAERQNENEEDEAYSSRLKHLLKTGRVIR